MKQVLDYIEEAKLNQNINEIGINDNDDEQVDESLLLISCLVAVPLLIKAFYKVSHITAKQIENFWNWQFDQ